MKNISFYERYEIAREKKGLTNTDVSRAIGISPAAMTGWKKGAMPTIDKFKATCKLLEVSADDLLELANEWREDRDEITKEEFIQRIGTPNIIINADGSIVFMFDSDEMFTDHGIEIYIDEHDNITGSDIV